MRSAGVSAAPIVDSEHDTPGACAWAHAQVCLRFVLCVCGVCARAGTRTGVGRDCFAHVAVGRGVRLRAQRRIDPRVWVRAVTTAAVAAHNGCSNGRNGYSNGYRAPTLIDDHSCRGFTGVNAPACARVCACPSLRPSVRPSVGLNACVRAYVRACVLVHACVRLRVGVRVGVPARASL
jgi:hypothetical protein